MNVRTVSAAAALAGTAALVNLNVRRAERRNPPLGRFVEVDGVRLHYVEEGDGPPLVLLHGLGSMVEDFLLSGLVSEASQRYRVIVLDRPGYGHSERPRGRPWGPFAQAKLLKTFLEKLDVHQPIVLGHSWGTLVAAAFALEYPGAARSLVLASGLYFPTVRLDAPLLIPTAIPVIGAIMRNTLSPLLARAMWPASVRLLFAPAEVPPHFLEHFPAAMAVRPSQLRAVGQDALATLPATIALSRRYPELTLPVVLLAGRLDRYVRARKHTLRLHRLIPASQLLMSQNAGHMIHHADLPLVLKAIDAAAA